MITFKQYLAEGSSGPDKWEKYFSSGDVETLAKKDADLFDVFDKKVKKTVKKGDKIKVLFSDKYVTKVKVRIGDGEYLMKFTDVDKPFKVERVVGIDLKPDKLGLFGPKFMSKYGAEVKRLLDSHTDIPTERADYLKALVDLAESPDDNDLEDAAKELYISTGTKDDQAFKNTINNDFMEVLGPFFVVNEKPEYKAGGVQFPVLGNQPLYDFTMKAKQGANENIVSFSSKRSGGNTNTLKVSAVLNALKDADPKFKKKFSREIELMKLIDENSIKATPGKINQWLANTFSSYEKLPDATDIASNVNLERLVTKWINENSGMTFIPVVQQAVPDLWYVKSRLASDGTLKVEPLKSGQEITKAIFRSKSSSGHMADKLGFAL